MKLLRRIFSWAVRTSMLVVFSLSMMIAGVAFSGLTAIVSSIAERAGISTALSSAEEVMERQKKQLAEVDVKNNKLNNQVAELGTANKKLNNQVADLANELDVRSSHVRNVDEVLQRVVKRTGVGLSRELGETALSWAPVIGTSVAVVTIAWDVKDACDTIQDIDYLIDIIESETTSIYSDPKQQNMIIELCSSNQISIEQLDQRDRNTEITTDFDTDFTK